MSLGLYVHVPFCSSICNYCNFNRSLFDAEVKTRYVAALLEEIRTAVTGRRPIRYSSGAAPRRCSNPPRSAP